MFDFGEMEEHYARRGDDPAARTLPKLLESPWLGITRHNERARIRLFCFTGVGVPAASFEEWAGVAMHQRYPSVEVAVIELPGHGANDAAGPFDDYVACARAAAVEISRIHFPGRGGDGRRRPFALYGNSLGSRVAAEVAAITAGPDGERCRKLYVSGRGAPHIAVQGGMSRTPDVDRMEPGQLKELMMTTLAPGVLKEQLDKYSRWMDMMMRQPGAKSLYRFAKATFGDSVMGTGPPRRSLGPDGGVVECPVHYYHGGSDANWPLARAGLWDNLPETWSGCTSGGFSWSECAGATHGDMGSVQSPAFPLICEDLTRLVASESLK